MEKTPTQTALVQPRSSAVTEEREAARQAFLDEINSLPQNGFPEWYLNRRREGAEIFRNTPFPHTRMEEWRQTNLAPILTQPFRSVQNESSSSEAAGILSDIFYGAEGWNELGFINGFYGPSVSHAAALPEGAYVGSLRQFLAHNSASSAQDFLGRIAAPRNAFVALNSALHTDGAMLYLPDGVQLEKPVHFVFVVTGEEPNRALHLRHLLILGKGARAQVIYTFVGSTSARYLTNSVEEVYLGEGADLQHVRIVQEGMHGYHMHLTEFHLTRDAHVHSFGFTISGALVRNQICPTFHGEGGKAQLVGLYLNDDKRLIDNALDIKHAAPSCFSRITYKGILDGESRAVFTGHVHVVPDAQKTDSDQISSNLLLHDGAMVHARPQLEIFADDVKCTHGATVGSFPPEVIFYFRSRGIDEPTARAMLTYGFADEIVDELEVEPVRERLAAYIYEKYSPKL